MTKDGHIYGETYKYWVYDMERFRGTMTEDYMAVGTRKYSCAKGIQSKF